MPDKAAGAGEETAENTAPADTDAAAPAATDAKAKFREALERKNQRAGRGAAAADGNSKIHGAHGAASHKREFRRKAGG